jgi:hypothetical protein
MPVSYRPLALIAVCGLALACTACNSNSKKIVGKWKMVSMIDKDGKEQKMDLMGMTPVMEFTSDGKLMVGLDTSNMPAEFRQKMEEDKEAVAKMSETKEVGKYKVSGSTLEFQDMKGSGDNPFGKKNRGTMKFNGDNLTLTGDDGTLNLTRLK